MREWPEHYKIAAQERMEDQAPTTDQIRRARANKVPSRIEGSREHPQQVVMWYAAAELGDDRTTSLVGSETWARRRARDMVRRGLTNVEIVGVWCEPQ